MPLNYVLHTCQAQEVLVRDQPNVFEGKSCIYLRKCREFPSWTVRDQRECMALRTAQSHSDGLCTHTFLPDTPTNSTASFIAPPFGLFSFMIRNQCGEPC